MYNVVLKVLEEIEKHGFKAYVVGGYARDRYMDRKSSDIDICTNATPMDLKEIFKVKYVDNVRGDNGRVEYVVANTTKANQLLNSYSKVINNLPTYQNTRLMKGEKLLLGDINGI
jgi:hypothetical protein